MRLPLLAGAGGKAMLCQMPDDEIDRILSKNILRKFTRYSSIDKSKYKNMLKKARREGIAFDKEEYIEGIRALAVPLKIENGNSLFAIWAVGLKGQIKNDVIGTYADLLKKYAKEIEIRLSNE
jgi:IclR family KDG regulon transcriptional repressor